MARFNTAKYNERLKKLAQWRQSQKQYISANYKPGSDLEAQELKELETTTRTERAKIETDFRDGAEKEREPLTRKATPKPHPREKLHRQAQDDAGSYVSTHTPEMLADLQIEAMESVGSKLDNFLEMWALIHRSEDWYRKERDRAMANKDVSRLKQLSRPLPLLPDGDVSERLQTIFSESIAALEKELMTPVERKAGEELAEFDYDVRLFEGKLEAFDLRGEYEPYGDAAPVPENETVLHWEGSRGLPPGQSNGGTESAEG